MDRNAAFRVQRRINQLGFGATPWLQRERCVPEEYPAFP